MAFLRHLQLYLWKNALQKGRNAGITCCELLTPIVLVGLFAWLYTAVDMKTNPDTTYECNVYAASGAKYDFIYLPRALNLTNTQLGVVGPADVTAAFTQHLMTRYPGLPQAVLDDCQCMGYATEQSADSFPSGGGFDAFTPAFIRPFPDESSLEAYTQGDDYGMDTSNPGIYAAVVFTGSGPQWSYKVRANHSALFDTHILRDDLARGSNLAVISNYVYDAMFGDRSMSVYMPGFTAIQTAVDRFIAQQTGRLPAPPSIPLPSADDALAFASTWGCVNATSLPCLSHTLPLGAFLQSHSLFPQHPNLAPFPTSAYRNNDFYSFVGNVFAMIFVLSFFFPSFFLIRGLVVEKETKIREGVRMMGLGDGALFSAWFITYTLMFIFIAFAIAITVKATFFPASDGGLVFLFFALFGFSAVCLCFVLSTFFSKAKLAAAVGAVLFIAAFFPYYTVNDATKGHGAKTGGSLLSPVAFGLGIDVLTTLESNGQGVGWATLYEQVNGSWSMGASMGLLLLDCCLYILIGIYLNNVLPNEFGVPLPFYYPLTVKYWRPSQAASMTWWESIVCTHTGADRCCRGRGTGAGNAYGSSGGDSGLGQSLLGGVSASGSVNAAPLLGSSTGTGTGSHEALPFASVCGAGSRYGEIGVASGSHIEAPGVHLSQLAVEGRTVSVRSLVKTFPTPDGTKTAVDRLELDMFEGQIFVLLGHNGAGKSTTISMLTGLIPPTSGDAYVYGASMSRDMGAIRTSLGVCPQHDVLWPDLTVKEHLVFFAGIKGVPRALINDQVMAMIREVGLLEKTNVLSSQLSGGQKRKLSVGIALIGGSKVVFLDEPTSGMDPYSRRFTWNLLQSNRAGRIMVLTTHFMDEADVLGDRIGIMAAGALRCCGSPMFLKGRYGVGYNLTLVKGQGCDPQALEALVRRHVTDGGVRVLSNVGSEMAFQVPLGASHTFPALFADLEAHITATVGTGNPAPVTPTPTSPSPSSSTIVPGRVSLLTYGVGVTTMEEVFLRVAEEGEAHPGSSTGTEKGDGHGGTGSGTVVVRSGEEEGEETRRAAAQLAAAKEERMSRRLAAGNANGSKEGGSMGTFAGGQGDTYRREGGADWATGSGSGGSPNGWATFSRHFRALLCKRWLYARRDRRALFFQLLIPVAALLVGLLLLHQVNMATWPAVPLDLSPYNTGLPSLPGTGSTLPPNLVPILSTNGTKGLPSPLSNASNVAPIADLAAFISSAGNVAGGTNLYAGSANNATFVTLPYGPLTTLYTYNNSAVASGLNITALIQQYLSSNGTIPASLFSVPGPCGSYDPAVNSLLPNWGLVAQDAGFYQAPAVYALSRWLLDAKNGTNPLTGQPMVTNGASLYGAYVVHDLRNDSSTPGDIFTPSGPYVSYTALVNTTGFTAAPSLLAIMHSGLINWLTGGANASISVTNAPLPFTKREATVVSSITSFIAVLFIVIAFSFVPASFAVFIVREREVKAKHQQLISGVSMPAYWLATYCWDALNYTVPCAAAIILIVAFNVTELVGGSLGATISLFVTYGLSVASFTYLLTYLFTSHSSAQILTLILNLLCVVLLLASFVMQQIPSTCNADSHLRFIYRLLPGYSLGNGLLQLSLLKELPYLESQCGQLSFLDRVQQHFTPFSWEVTGYPLAYMITQSVVYFLLAIGIDVLLSYPVIRSRLLPDKDVPQPPYEEDEDVTAEARRVDGGGADGEIIRLSHLRKVYAGGKTAVRDLSFGIPQGEVFGFLGINGAGKTTTLKMLSGDEIPTRGTATLGGHDILREQVEVRRLLGYCPQFDALLDLLTVREHLELYARIKGVPESRLSSVVDAKLGEMDLVQYANKLAGSLSGGNKRKLSVAIAMIGDPPLVFLDEPSTGMDPVARRFMWNVIAKIATERQQCSIILTTHSMEECEALCTRVGIMVGGRMRCLGPIQHLKNKFGKGYLAVIKLAAPPADRIRAVLGYLEPFLTHAPLDADRSSLSLSKRPTSGIASALLGPAGGAAASTAAVATAEHGGEAGDSFEAWSGRKVPMNRLKDVCAALGDPIRQRMIHPAGSGWSLAATFQKEQAVDAVQFAEWWAVESLGAALHAYMGASFPGARLLERHGEFFRYQLPDLQGVPLSGLFACMEREKARLHVAEYSLSQTSLEAIFNTMAQQDDAPGMGAAPGMAGGGTAPSAAQDAHASDGGASAGAYHSLNGGDDGAATNRGAAGSVLHTLTRAIGAATGTGPSGPSDRPHSVQGVEFRTVSFSAGATGGGGTPTALGSINGGAPASGMNRTASAYRYDFLDDSGAADSDTSVATSNAGPGGR